MTVEALEIKVDAPSQDGVDKLLESLTQLESKLKGINGSVFMATIETQMAAMQTQLQNFENKASQSFERRLRDQASFEDKQHASANKYHQKQLEETVSFEEKQAAAANKYHQKQLEETISFEEKQAAAANKYHAKLEADTLRSVEVRLAAERKAQETLGAESARMIEKRISQMQDLDVAAHKARIAEEGHGFSLSSATAKVELARIAHDGLIGSYSRMGSAAFVFSNVSGLSTMLFSAQALAIGGVVAVFGLLAYEMYKGVKQHEAMNNALIMTGNYAGTSVAGLKALADQAVSTGGNIGVAREAVLKLAESGKFTSGQIGTIASAAVAMEHATGQSIDVTIKQFESLAVEMSGSTLKSTEAVTKAAVKLDDTYHFLTPAILNNIIALEKEGHAKEASKVATDELSRVTEERADEMIEKLGNLSKAWIAVKDVIASAKKDLLDWGAPNTPDDTLNKLLARRDVLRKSLRTESSIPFLGGAFDRADRQELEDLIPKIKEAKKAFNEFYTKVNSDSATSRLNSEVNHLMSAQSELLAKHKKDIGDVQGALDRLHASWDVEEKTAGGRAFLTPEVKRQLEAATIKDNTPAGARKDSTRIDMEAEIDHQKALYRLTEEATRSNEKLLADSYKAREIDSDTYYDMLKRGREDEKSQLEATTNEEIEILKKRHNKDEVDKSRTLKQISQIQDAYLLARQKIEDAQARSDLAQMLVGSGKINNLAVKTQFDAQKLFEAGDALATYGKHAKETALQIAELAINQERLQDTVKESAADNLRSAAILKDLGSVYLDLEKYTADLVEKEKVASASSLENVTGAETLKVAVWQTSAEKYVELEWLKANAAIDAARAASPTGMADPMQEQAFAKAAEAHDKATAEINKASAKKFEVAGLKDTATLLDHMSKSASTLGDSFKGVTVTLSGMSKVFKEFADMKERENSGEKISNAEKIGAYGDMADAASNFFDKQSAGYKTLHGVAEVFHLAQVAMNMIQMGQMAVKAVLTQAQGDPYSAWARMAAMAAAVAALGFAVGGGFSHDSGDGASAANMQKIQGTGTVLGDAAAKSQSISKAMDDLKKNSDVTLPISQGMLAALNSIDAAMTGVAQILFRTAGITSGATLGIADSSVGKEPAWLQSGISSVMGLATKGMTLTNYSIGGVFGGMLGNFETGIDRIVQNLISGLFGKTSSGITDSGLTINGSLGGVSQGQGIGQYANVHTTSSSFWGLVKDSSDSRVSGAVDQDIANQIGKVFKNISDTIKLASTEFVTDTTSVTEMLANFVVNIPTVSLRGLTGQALNDALNAVFSSFSDTLAKTVLPGLEDFQRVGEGYFQTVIRVASGIEAATSAMKKLGLSAVDYTAIINRQGDVATEISRQSILGNEIVKQAQYQMQSVTHDVVSQVGYTFQQMVEQMIPVMVGEGSPEGSGEGGVHYISQWVEEAQQGFKTVTTSVTENISTLVSDIKYSGIGDIINNFTGSFADLIKLYTELTDARNQMKVSGLGGDLSASTLEGAGGVSQLTSGIKSFQDKFFTDAEKAAMQTAILSGQFAKLGVTLPTSNAAFRSLVQGIDTSTDSGQKLQGELLALAGSFSALSDQKTTVTATFQTAIDNLKTFKASVLDFSKSLLTGTLSTLTPLQKLAELQGRYTTDLALSKAGDLAAQSRITSEANDYLSQSQILNASSPEYIAATLQVQNDMASLAAAVDPQISAQQQQIDALGVINTTLTDILKAVSNGSSGSSGFISSDSTSFLLGGTSSVGNKLSNHATGLVSVPYDNYPANLHAKESVIDAQSMASFRRYFGAAPGSGNSEAVVAELKAVRAELAALRADQERQTGDQIHANYDANTRAAGVVVEGTKEAAKDAAWSEKVQVSLV